MASSQSFRSRHRKIRASVRKSFSDDVFQSVKSLLQSEKALCSVSAEDCAHQEEHAAFSEVTFLGFNEETDAAHVQELAAVSLELPALLNSLHFCSLNENEIICMKDMSKSSGVSSGPPSQSHSGMLCVMRVSPPLPRLRVDFIFSLLSKYATGIKYTLDSHLHRQRQPETVNEDDDDTNQSVSSIEDDFVTAFEQLEEEETSKPYNEGVNVAALRSQSDAASQAVPGRRVGAQDVKVPDSSRQQKSCPKASASPVNALGRRGPASVRTTVTTSVSEPWTQRSFYRSSTASGNAQKAPFSSSPAYSSGSECSSPSPIIFLDEEGYQKSLRAKLDLPKIPVMKDDVEDSDSEVSEFFDSFDRFDELEPPLESACPCPNEPHPGKSSHKKGHKPEKSRSVTTTMNPQKFKSDRPLLPAGVKKPTPRKPGSPCGSLCEAPDSPRPVQASGDDGGLFSPIRSSAFSPLGGCPPGCLCQAGAGGDGAHGDHDPARGTGADYAEALSCAVLDSVLHSQPASARPGPESLAKEDEQPLALQGGGLDPESTSRTRPLMIRDSMQKFAADLVEKSLGSAFKDLRKGVSSCTGALCHLAITLASSVLQTAFNELKSQRAFSLREHAISGLAHFLVSEALSSAFRDLQRVKKQMFTSALASFAADLAEELVFEGLMEVCQFSCPPTPASPRRGAFGFEDKEVKSYAQDLSESVMQEAFIELSQVDVAFTARAAVSVSTNNISCVSAEDAPLPQASPGAPTSTGPAAPLTKPEQDSRKGYTVQQALFCSSGIAASVPVPVAGSVLLPHRVPPDVCRTGPALASDGGMSRDESKPAPVAAESKDEDVACLRNVCAPSEQDRPGDASPRGDGPAGKSASELTGEPGVMSDFPAAAAHPAANESFASATPFRVPEPVAEHADGVSQALKGSPSPLHSEPAESGVQCRGARSKDLFAGRLSDSILRHSMDKSSSVILGVGGNLMLREASSVPAEASHLTLEKFPRSPAGQDHVIPSSLPVGRDCVPAWNDSVAPEFSLEMLPLCSTLANQNPDVKELAKDKPVEKHELSSAAHEALCLGQENPFPSSTALTCVDGLHAEDKHKAGDGNVVPNTPPPTPLVPSQAASEWDLQRLSQKLKGELANEFAPATPPSTPHNSSGGGLSDSEQHAIEKEEFMLKLMRSLSEEVDSSEGGGRPEEGAKPQCPGEKIQFAETLATNIVSFATEAAASRAVHEVALEPKGKSPCSSVRHQRGPSPACVGHADENAQAACSLAGGWAAEVLPGAEEVAGARSCALSRPKNSRHGDGDREPPSEERLDAETAAPPADMDPFFLSFPSSSGTSGLAHKYPSCESVTDEYAGHVIQLLKQEGGNSELIVDQYANRLAYRSVKSGLQEAAKTASRKSSSDAWPGQSPRVHPQARASSEPLVSLSKACPQEAAPKRRSERNGGCCRKIQACDRTQPAHGNELSGFSTSLARSITKDAQKELAASVAALPTSLTEPCLYEKAGSHAESGCPQAPQPSPGTQRCLHRAGSLAGSRHGQRVVHAIEEYAQKVVDDTLVLSLGPTAFHGPEATKAAGRLTYAEKLSPLPTQSCRHCDREDLHDCTGNPPPPLPGRDALASRRSAPPSRHGSFFQKSRIFHLDVPQIHVDVDKKVVLAERLVAEAIDKAERELISPSLAGDSGLGQEGISFAESLSTEILTSAMASHGHLSSLKDLEDIPSAEPFGSRQMSVSIGEDSIGSWSNLSFEDEHQDESSSFHHLSESDGSDGEEDEDDAEGLEQDGRTLLVANIDMEPCTVDPQLRIILQWLIASEADVAELYLHDSAKKEFIRLSKQLQTNGWKVGDLLQAVLKYYEVMEKTASAERRKSLFDWLLENA